MSNKKQSSTVGYTFMNSDFEINSIESHNMWQNSVLLVDMLVVCRSSRYKF
jgi:hypothetical protein